MLRVTRLTDYATLVLATLARASEPMLSAAGLAERARLEATTVAKVLKPLVHAGLVESFRGAAGGYRLARPPMQVSLLAIVEAIEGPLGMTDCAGDHSSCEHEPHCDLLPHWRRINEVIADALGAVTLAQLLPPDPSRAIPLTLAPAKETA
ncbi:SUF system Fe-S cluster assembly regulator [Arenimonas composti]|nr:SUF system Fe-S cluster assembly regulator [Arenimonas composti]